ncbi:MAG: STAS/SEC14 domain-containing protein [Planctomycetaceae bacterium]
MEHSADVPVPHSGFRMTDQLRDEDDKQFVPEVDTIPKKADQVRLLAWFDDFHRWDLHALWDDMQFGITHYANIDDIALVGDRKWEEWMAKKMQAIHTCQNQVL